jgi:hypothetical protein
MSDTRIEAKAEMLIRNPVANVFEAFVDPVISAASGMKGDSDQMLVLSQARAMVLRDYLVGNFKMIDTRVKTLARGKTPSAPVDGGIEILIYPPSSASPARSK